MEHEEIHFVGYGNKQGDDCLIYIVFTNDLPFINVFNKDQLERQKTIQPSTYAYDIMLSFWYLRS